MTVAPPTGGAGPAGQHAPPPPWQLEPGAAPAAPAGPAAQLAPPPASVSYTHLRAHETSAHL
eukprot:15192062-Alexandrium_andersonii.AAC.1